MFIDQIKVARKAGLTTFPQLFALLLIARSERPLALSQIADSCEISRASITGTADALQELGLAVRFPHPTDRRVITLVPSVQGRELATAIQSLEPATAN